MIINAAKISLQTKIKIYEKHGIVIKEIENVLLQDKPYFAKTRFKGYVVLGKWDRYITIVFIYDERNKEAEIITAYLSSDWQIKLYKRKMRS